MNAIPQGIGPLGTDIAPLLTPLTGLADRRERCVAASRSVAKVPPELRTAGYPDDVMYALPFGSAYADAVFRIVRWLPGAYIEMIMAGNFTPLLQASHKPEDFQLIGLSLAKAWLAAINPVFFFKGQPRFYSRACDAYQAMQGPDTTAFERWAGQALDQLKKSLKTASGSIDPLSSPSYHTERGLAVFAFVVVQTLFAVVDPQEIAESAFSHNLRWNGKLDGRDLAAALHQIFSPLPDLYTCSVVAHQFLQVL